MIESVFWMVILVLQGLNFSAVSRVRLENNGYKDVVVAFPTDTDEEERPRLVRAAQDVFASSSVALYIATRRRAYFKDVIFLFPKSWRLEELPGNVNFTTAGLELYEEADIVLTSDDFKRSMPYTLHDGGCGEESVRILMPTHFLLSEMEQEEKDRRLVHEWSQYRYGVFAEGGFKNDLRYPIYYSVPGKTNIQVTACTNTLLNYTNVNSESLPCSPEVNPITGRPTNDDCTFIPVVHNDAPLQSSLMYQQSLPHTFQFCDGDLSMDRRHNPAPPSKHNTLCGEEGTWFIILRNSDFRRGRNQASRYKPLPITFKYVQETSLRVVVVVEDSAHMNEKSRYDQVKRSTAKFILYDLPEESEVGLISFSQQVSGSATLQTLTSQSSRKRFLESDYIPSVPKESDQRCSQCAISTALKLLQDDASDPKYGGVIILVTTTSFPEDSMQFLINNLTTSGIRLYVILMSADRHPSVTLETLASATSGKVFYIPESETGPSATALSHLFIAFGTVVKGHSWKEEEEILVTQSIISGDTSDISFTFGIDSPLGRDMKVIITGATFNERKSFLVDSFTTLQSGTETISFFERSEFLSAWIFSIQEAQTGNWTLKTTRKDGATDPVLIIVSSKQRENQTAIVGRLWLNIADQQIDPKGTKPLKIYSEIRIGMNPVAGAQVTASVYHPGGEIVSEFLLLDDGIGDPDVTKNDGIYSSYFSNFTQVGHYSVIVRTNDNNNEAQILTVASDPCCGSFVPAESAVPIGSFTRVIGYDSFLVTSQPPETDVIPPNRITDLLVTEADPQERRFTLQWTAAGDDYNHGSASSYRLKVFRDRTELRRRFDETGLLMDLQRDVTQHSEPTDYGGLQQFSVRLPETLESGDYYFGVTAEDDAQNTGPVSNTALIYIGPRPKNETEECEKVEIETKGSNFASSLEKDANVLKVFLLIFFHFFRTS